MGSQPAGSAERPVPGRLASITGRRPSTMPPPTNPIQIQRPPPRCTSVSSWSHRQSNWSLHGRSLKVLHIRSPRALPLGLAQLSLSHPISHLPTCPALFPSPELWIMHQLSRYVVFLLPLS
ncbi:hypothetical protein ACQJBY_068454 [Aegilops geniculata]